MTDRQKLSDISDPERQTRIDLAALFRTLDTPAHRFTLLATRAASFG